MNAHWDAIAATDFLTVDVWISWGLVRCHMLCVKRFPRQIHIAGIVPEPEGPWMSQMDRNLTDASDDFLRGCRFLIQDRSSLFAAQFRDILK